ncbi:BREX-3 system P-loop-containing protein BrxF [Thiolapillus sp.]|uniref:BREX-3 system P-loop-containing protein BrxF n=3 Tax=Thiolapillus sp. TaxID=2017437 RepID=UPI003AF807EA
MAGATQDKIKRSLQAAEGLYHRLVLLVGEAGSGKTSVLRDVAKDFGTEVVNVNLALSAELLELTAKQRALRLPGILDQIVDKEQSPVVLDNLEILFDKDLKQDPLRLLQGISRNRSVVASWNGKATEGKLNYAEAGHPEYRSYDLVDLTVVGMDETATVDSAQIGRIADLDEPRSGSPAGGQAKDGLSSKNNRETGQA